MPRFILTCCFESLWARLTTGTWNDWANFLLLLIPYHMLKTNFIIQLILEIKLPYYILSLWLCPGMPDHTHLEQPNNICCFMDLYSYPKISFSFLNLFVKYSSLKNPAFWLVLRFLDHNWKTRFFSNIMFLEKVKRPLTFSCWSKKSYISEGIKFFVKS